MNWLPGEGVNPESERSAAAAQTAPQLGSGWAEGCCRAAVQERLIFSPTFSVGCPCGTSSPCGVHICSFCSVDLQHPL